MLFHALTNGVCLTQLDGAAADELDRLALRCADFTRLIQGREPAPSEGRDVLTDSPPEFPLRDKVVLGVRSDNGLIGVVDLLRGYPSPQTWWIGLLLLVPEARGGGLGREIVEMLADWAAGEGAASLRLSAQAQNEGAVRFWRRRGFEQLRTVERQDGRLKNLVLVMERRLGGG